jgi:hypothetical protein
VKFKPSTGPTFGTFPYLFDVSGNGLEGLRVLVADEDASGAECHLYLWAHDAVDLGVSAQA